MAIKSQCIKDEYALYHGDCIEVMREMPEKSIHLSIYSPPFGGLYMYSSDISDMSNSVDKTEFFEHYGFCIDQISRLTVPGRLSFVHCMDIPLSNAGCDAIYDLAGNIIREHESRGFRYAGRRVIWKEPLGVRNRTMMKSLHHKTICEDSSRCSIANADWLLMFRRTGENKIPVEHPTGILHYAGDNIPADSQILAYQGMKGDQKQNLYSQWIWRNYASSVWMDIRIDNVLPFRNAKGSEDEKHIHPLQLDVIERACVLGSNPGEIILTPFMGVGSEVYGAVINGRKAIGIELKESYYNQAVRNLRDAKWLNKESDQMVMQI